MSENLGAVYTGSQGHTGPWRARARRSRRDPSDRVAESALWMAPSPQLRGKLFRPPAPAGMNATAPEALPLECLPALGCAALLEVGDCIGVHFSPPMPDPWSRASGLYFLSV